MKQFASTLSLALLLLFSGCKKKTTTPENPTTEDPKGYTIPSTYEFGANMDLTPATKRIAMLRELVTYVRSTHNPTTNIVISEDKLKAMYANTGAPFTDAGALGLNSAGFNLKEKTSNAKNFQTYVNTLFAEAAVASQGTVSGSNGVSGKVLGPAPSSPTAAQSVYLLNAQGFEYKELIEKGFMGSFLYAEGCTLLKNIGTYDNTTVIAGKGTAMEQAWDQAFGYFGVPVSFPTSTANLSYWGSYCNSVNPAINSNSTMMNAWLKGRAAIRAKDAAARDAARDVLLSNWEKIAAARLISYLKQAKSNYLNDGARSHALSEGIGFIRAFGYNPAKTIAEADISTLENYIGNNLYTTTLADIDQAIGKTATVFNLDASKL